MRGLKKSRRKEVFKIEVTPEGPDGFLKGIPRGEDPGTGLIGLGKSGKKNLSGHHDKYLARYTRQKRG